VQANHAHRNQVRRPPTRGLHQSVAARDRTGARAAHPHPRGWVSLARVRYVERAAASPADPVKREGDSSRCPPQPADGRRLDINNRTYNTLLRSLRGLGERGFALLVGRWRVLQHITACPRKIGPIAKAALVLTHFEHRMHILLRSPQ
jgi:hypothetical protein